MKIDAIGKYKFTKSPLERYLYTITVLLSIPVYKRYTSLFVAKSDIILGTC
jgi:putative effector of murein hydrolase